MALLLSSNSESSCDTSDGLNGSDDDDDDEEEEEEEGEDSGGEEAMELLLLLLLLLLSPPLVRQLRLRLVAEATEARLLPPTLGQPLEKTASEAGRRSVRPSRSWRPTTLLEETLVSSVSSSGEEGGVGSTELDSWSRDKTIKKISFDIRKQ